MVAKREDKLAGKRVAVKDNICVAGIPMMNGSAIIEGYIPDDDATVVQRILNEGTLNISRNFYFAFEAFATLSMTNIKTEMLVVRCKLLTSRRI